MGVANSCLASDSNRTFDDRDFRYWLVRRWPIEKAIESASWHWFGNFRPRLVSIHFWLVDVGKRTKKEKVVRADQSYGMWVSVLDLSSAADRFSYIIGSVEL